MKIANIAQSLVNEQVQNCHHQKAFINNIKQYPQFSHQVTRKKQNKHKSSICQQTSFLFLS